MNNDKIEYPYQAKQKVSGEEHKLAPIYQVPQSNTT